MIQNIIIVGLGLIGGSMAKAAQRSNQRRRLLGKTDIYRVIGLDVDERTLRDAVASGAVQEAYHINDCAVDALLGQADIFVAALLPKAAVDVICNAAPKLQKGCIVTDICGVKEYVCESVRNICRRCGLTFVGGHPMAGKEFWGFEYADATLYDNASMILTPERCEEKSVNDAVAVLSAFYEDLGFAKVVITSADDHDRMIAYTSQLAHVVSNAYIKSPEAFRHEGYSAGSYRDLTRVAKLNVPMWTELFLMNKDALLRELDILSGNLDAVRECLVGGDADRLSELLREGSELKMRLDG